MALVERPDVAELVREAGYEPVVIERAGPPITEATAKALQYSRVVLMPENDVTAMVEAGRLLYEFNGEAPPDVRIMPAWPSWVARTKPNMWDALDAAPEWQRPRPDPSAWTLTDLMRAKFAPVAWLVKDLIPAVGFVLLAGREKWGKSWLTLQLAVAVASGGTFLDRSCTRGKVLVLALEDTPQRLQERLRLQQLADFSLPVSFRPDFPALDEDGLDALRQLAADERPQLVIIDTLTAALSGKLDEDSARELGPVGKALRRLAQEFGLTVLLTHHHHKGESRDVGADSRGSSTLPAAADTIVGVYEKDGAARLVAKGRDIARCELNLRFDAGATFCWHVRHDTRDDAREATDDKAIDALRRLGGEADAEALADELECKRPQAVKILRRLDSRGRVRPRKDGSRVIYTLVEADDDPARDGEHLEHLEHPAHTNGGVPPVPGVPGSAALVADLFPDAERVPGWASAADDEGGRP